MVRQQNVVTLRHGPFDGVQVLRPTGRSLIVEMVQTDRVARYRQSRDPDVFTFREFDTVVGRLDGALKIKARGI